MMKMGLRISAIVLIALIHNSAYTAEFVQYQVRKGDNLVQILKRLGVSNPYSKQRHIEVAQLNPETVQNEGALISAGSTIRIPVAWTKQSTNTTAQPSTTAQTATQAQSTSTASSKVPKTLPQKVASAQKQTTVKQVAIVDMSQESKPEAKDSAPTSEGGVISLGTPGEADPTPAAAASTQTEPAQVEGTPSTAVEPEVTTATNAAAESSPAEGSPTSDSSISGELVASSSDALISHQRLSVQPRYQWSRIEFVAPAYPEILVLKTNESYGVGLAMNWFRGGDWESSIEYSYRHANFIGPRGYHLDQEEQDLFQYRLEMAYYSTPFWRWALFSEGQQELIPHPISAATISLDRTWQYRFGGRIGYQSALPGSPRIIVGLEAAAILPHSVERYQLDPTALLRGDVGLGLPIHAATEWLFQLSYEGYQQSGPGFEHATQHLGALVSLSLKL